MKMLLAHAHAAPDPPSARTEMPIPADLEALILSCLAKDREARPRSARDLLHRLDAISFRQPWTDLEAHEWWKLHMPRESTAPVL